MADVRLNPYAETGDANALSFGEARIRSRMWQLGSSVLRSFSAVGAGRWTAEGRAEFRRSVSGGLVQEVGFTESLAESALMQSAGTTQEALGVSTTVRYVHPSGMVMGVSWGWMGGSHIVQRRLGMQWQFPL